VCDNVGHDPAVVRARGQHRPGSWAQIVAAVEREQCQRGAGASCQFGLLVSGLGDRLLIERRGRRCERRESCRSPFSQDAVSSVAIPVHWAFLASRQAAPGRHQSFAFLCVPGACAGLAEAPGHASLRRRLARKRALHCIAAAAVETLLLLPQKWCCCGRTRASAAAAEASQLQPQPLRRIVRRRRVLPEADPRLRRWMTELARDGGVANVHRPCAWRLRDETEIGWSRSSGRRSVGSALVGIGV